MPLQTGTRLGPYEVVAKVGAGGMGEVYKAHDTRLNRDVALKVLPSGFAPTSEQIQRFEQEARATAALNHPNIVVVFDVGTDAGTGALFVVTELLEGATLREEIKTALSPRKAVDWGVQIANGLAAAHEKNIVHRDVKPENIFVTRDGRVKILDFGIARMAMPEPSSEQLTVEARGTAPGMVIGTAGYMSPEQVRAQPVDARSDIFSLGAVLHEMITGRRVFSGGSIVETMNAILTVDPPALADVVDGVPPALDRIVRRCLEKRPGDRFHSAHDLALALEATAGSRTHSGPATAVVAETKAPARRGSVVAYVGIALATAAVLVGVAAATGMLSKSPPPTMPTFTRLTFRQGTIESARFVPGSTDVIYSARWQGAPPTLALVHQGSPESQPIGQPDSILFAVSRQDVAVMLNPRVASGGLSGTLATIPVGGGGAREVATRIVDADFIGDAGDLVFAEYTGDRTIVHLRSGAVIHNLTARILAIRTAPDNERVALFESNGHITVIDRKGTSQSRFPVGPITSFAWSPAGAEIWATEFSRPGQTTIAAFRLDGTRREVFRSAGDLILEDIAPTGDVLMHMNETQNGVMVQRAGQPVAADLGWLDGSQAVDVSPDGNTILFTERGSAGGSFYMRAVDGSAATRLGPGEARAFSSDGKLTLSYANQQTFAVIPVGAGAPREFKHPGIRSYFGWFLPNDDILFNGQEGAKPWRFYRIDTTGTVSPFGPDGVDHWAWQHVLSDDGKLMAVFPSGRNGLDPPSVYPVDGGAPIQVKNFTSPQAIIRFTPDGQKLLVYNREQLPVRIEALDYRTGQRALWREFSPADPTGISGVESIAMTPDGRVVAYNYERRLGTLYVIAGLR